MDPVSPTLVLLGTLLTVVGAAAVLPQAVRTWRTGDGEGLSVGTCFLALGAMLAWCTYTHRIGDWPALAGSVAPALGWALVVVAGVVRGVLPARGAALAGAGAVLGVGVLAWLHLDGTAAMLVGAVWAVPQAVRACRAERLSGVSGAAWVLLLVESLGWVAYGTLAQNWLYVPASLAQVVVMALVLARLVAARRVSTPVVSLPTQRTPEPVRETEAVG